MPTIYGDNTILDDIRAELYAQLEALRVAMAAGLIIPRPAAIYDSHEQVKMTLPAISVGISSYSLRNAESARSSEATREIYDFKCDIRVHTDFRGGYADEVTTARVLNSINNWLEIHRDLNITGFCDFDLNGAAAGQSFDESLTLGGKLELTITLQLMHTQA